MAPDLSRRILWGLYVAAVAACLHVLSQEHGFVLLVLLVVLVPGWLKVLTP